MTILWMEGFDHYGTDHIKMLDGVWADFTSNNPNDISLGVPAAGARTGTLALKLIEAASALSFTTDARRVLTGTFDEIFVGEGIFMPELPNASDSVRPMQMLTSGAVPIITVVIGSDGGMLLHGGGIGGAVLGQTTGQVIQAGTWHHLDMRFVRDASSGIFVLRVDDVEVLNLTGLALGALGMAQLVVGMGNSLTNTRIMYVDDMNVRNTAGSRNNTFGGDLRVATLQPIANGANQGWTKRTIEHLGLGVMSFLDDTNQDMAIAYPDLAAYEIGSGDFAIEGFVRFSNKIPDDDTAIIWSKWRESTDERSWRLKLEGATVGGDLIFETSVLGTSGDLVDVHTFAFVPIVDRWYHLAVTRDGTDSRMFIDGIQVGVTQTDSRVYHNGDCALFVNGDQLTPTTTNDNGSVDGWMDGVRFTVGDARYSANFTIPGAALPTDLGGDSLYDSVELLLNFDDVNNTDSSSNAVAGTLIDGADVVFPDDDIAFQTISGLTPEDNDYVEAELVAATETITLTGLPLNTETVVIGGTTYTFLTVLVDTADNVLIGSDAEDSLANLEEAVKLGPGVGVKYGTGTVINPDALLTRLTSSQRLATARTKGAAGNSIVSTETLTNGSWGDTTFSGGLDIPPNSEFVMSALPIDVTGVRAISVIGRNFKTDGGAATLQMSYVHAGGASSAGPARSLTVNPKYYEDIHEVDPSTSGSLTPTSLVSARVRLNRTA